MVPVLGREVSGMRQIAQAEWQQDLDSPQTRRRSVRQSIWLTCRTLDGTVVRLGITGLRGLHTQ